MARGKDRSASPARSDKGREPIRDRNYSDPEASEPRLTRLRASRLKNRSYFESERGPEPMDLDLKSPFSSTKSSPKTPKSSKSPKTPEFLKDIPPGKGYKKFKEAEIPVVGDLDVQDLEKRLSKRFPVVSKLITPKYWPTDIYPISEAGLVPQFPATSMMIQLYVLKVSRAHARVPPNELRILSYLSRYHPRITPLKAFMTEGNLDILYFPYADAGDLATFIELYKIKKSIIPEAFIWHIMTHLIEAVYFLQYPKPDNENYRYTIWHLDIKPENVLMQWPPKNRDNTPCYPNIQLGGFGVPYAAPEQLRGYYNAKTDVWGIGATIHECVHGYPPLTPQKSHNTRARSIGTHTVYPRPVYTDLEWRGMPSTPRACWEMPGHYSSSLRDRLYHLLRVDPSPKEHENDLTKRVDIEVLKEYQDIFKLSKDYFVELPKWFSEARQGELGDLVKKEREAKIILGQDGLGEWRVVNMWSKKVEGWEVS
ncbi:protein kinase [Sclerotinia borealis F-4128]|uniref:non-specific serine/threonine protein kinase n=1 Tax=Sclerotinia borealis (strain F-4128) TaxID=1432307 RepID=W9CTK6_SCLBF|nr:protein kinase [Sclerotinia borealis F-4128]